MPPGTPSAGPDYKRVFSGESRPSLFEIAGVPVTPTGPGGRYPLSDYRPQIPDGAGGRMLGHPAGLLSSRKYGDLLA